MKSCQKIKIIPRGRSRAFVYGLSYPVLGLHSVGRLTSGRFCRVCLGTGDFLRPTGGHPKCFDPLRGGGYCLTPEAPQKGECRRCGRYFWPSRTRMGFGPATEPTLKTALCHIRALVGRIDKYKRNFSTAGQIKKRQTTVRGPEFPQRQRQRQNSKPSITHIDLPLLRFVESD